MKAVIDRGATRSLVLGLLSMWFGALAPFAIYAGARSLWRIRASEGRLSGGERALAGLAGGVVGLGVMVVGVLYWVSAG